MNITNESLRFMQVVPESHFFTDLTQIIDYIQSNATIDKKHLLTGLENTIKNGYNLKK
jgi:hypothetical protein